jgi:hypothetical protein
MDDYRREYVDEYGKLRGGRKEEEDGGLRRKENESLLRMMERWRMEEEGGQKVIEVGGESWKI